MIGREQLEHAVADYKRQLEQTQNQIQELERVYAAQREQGINAANQIHGAIVALEQLLTVVDPPAAPEVVPVVDGVAVDDVQDVSVQ